ncbi:hypothetical protein AALA17_04100 [Lactobacillaceae bacterium 24-114]
MKFLDGLGFGMMLSGVLFWIYLLAIQLLKNPNYKVLALIFVVIETVVTVIGIGISAYVMWRVNT